MITGLLDDGGIDGTGVVSLQGKRFQGQEALW